MKSLSQCLKRELRAELLRAEAAHGPLTHDRFRALAILGEEYGEACRAVLELRRAEAAGDFDRASQVLTNLRAELVQVAATALGLADQLF